MIFEKEHDNLEGHNGDYGCNLTEQFYPNRYSAYQSTSIFPFVAK